MKSEQHFYDKQSGGPGRLQKRSLGIELIEKIFECAAIWIDLRQIGDLAQYLIRIYPHLFVSVGIYSHLICIFRIYSGSKISIRIYP